MARYRTANGLRQRGYALLGLIAALMVMAVAMTAAVPNARTQAQRQLEIEMYHRGDHMAEAIARFYSQGKLGPAGLVVKTPPPPQGFLLELKKLRDGVTIGVNEVYFCRASAFIDPLTDDEWEPIRIGDPRLRKFFRAWQQATGRQLPPIYATYMGGAIVDTTEKPAAGDDDLEDEDDEFDEDEEDEDFDEEEEDEDGEDEDDEDEDEELQSRRLDAGSAYLVRAAFQVEQKPESNPTVQRPDSKPVFGDGTRRLTPIVGVVSKKKGRAIKTRYGIERYEEMIFIYIPPAFGVVPGGQVQQQQPNPGQGGSITDANGDGIDDNIKPNPNPNANSNQN